MFHFNLGMDYTALDTEIVFQPLQSSATVQIQLLGDSVVEDFEQFSVFLTVAPASSGFIFVSQSSVSVVLLNDDSEINLIHVK